MYLVTYVYIYTYFVILLRRPPTNYGETSGSVGKTPLNHAELLRCWTPPVPGRPEGLVPRRGRARPLLRAPQDVKPDGSFGKFDAEIPELLAEADQRSQDVSSQDKG